MTRNGLMRFGDFCHGMRRFSDCSTAQESQIYFIPSASHPDTALPQSVNIFGQSYHTGHWGQSHNIGTLDKVIIQDTGVNLITLVQCFFDGVKKLFMCCDVFYYG